MANISPTEEIIKIQDEINEGTNILRDNSSSIISTREERKDSYISNSSMTISGGSEEYALLCDNEQSSHEMQNPQMIEKPPQRNQRLYWADCARIFSMFAIVLLHTAGYGCEQNLRKKNNPNWKIICWYNCVTRFGVPMFVLLSGTFILDPSRKVTLKKLITKNIFRLATAFAFWSALNAFLKIFLYKTSKYGDFLKLFVVGEEYLWFIFMIIGCYLISPFLRLFSDNIFLTRYFLGLWLFWGSFIPTLKGIFQVLKLTDAENELETWTERWHYHFTLEFIGYFVAGYHIVKHVNIRSPIIRIFLYILCIADVVLMCYLTSSIEKHNGNKYSKEFRDTYTLTVAFYTFILFIFFKHEIGRINFSQKAIRIISRLSSLTFGMYLSHMVLKFLLSRFLNISQTKFFGYNYSPVIGVPVFCFIIIVLSTTISYIISITPVLRNYII